MARCKKQPDKLRDQEQPNVLGYDLDRETLTPIRRYVGDPTAKLPAPAKPVPRKKYDDMLRELAGACRDLAEVTDAEYRRCITQQLYLVGIKPPDSQVWTALAVAADTPDGWQIVHPDPLPRSQTVDHLCDTIRKMLSREPLWIFAD